MHFRKYKFITIMKQYKVSDIIRMLLEDGWYLHSQKGSHRQFKHPEKTGKKTK